MKPDYFREAAYMGSVALFFGILGFLVGAFGVVVTMEVVPVMANLEGMSLLAISAVLLLVGILAGSLKQHGDY